MNRLTIALLGLILTSACAVNSPTAPVHDPFENVNRKVFAFNDAIDRNVLVPVAKGYRFITPDFLEDGIGNFFSNVRDVTVLINGLLQGNFSQAASDTGRILVNTTVGIVGFIDVGSRIGLEKHFESFGQTLGVWGAGEGPFVMLPILGPNNIRSGIGLIPDSSVFSPRFWAIEDTGVQFGYSVAEIISLRASLLAAGNLLNTAALDPYLLLRDVWVQRHRRQTWNGTREVGIGTADDGGDIDDLDGLDELDELDALDELDELDALDELDELEVPDVEAPDELDALDALD